MAHPTARVRLRLPVLLLAALAALAGAAALEGLGGAVMTNEVHDEVEKIDDGEASQRCALYCKGTSGSPFTPGMRYVYEYSAEVSAAISVTAPNGPAMRLSATAILDARSPCELTLQLRDARLEERSGGWNGGTWEQAGPHGAALASALERLPLRVAVEGGRIAALCPAPGHEPWPLNIQRGLLSALQSAGDSVHEPRSRRRLTLLERDVSGVCLTTYLPLPDNEGGLIVLRSKDLNTCAHRSHSVLPLPAGSAAPAPGATPPLKPSLVCEQRFASNGTLLGSFCNERQLLRPFAASDTAGAFASAVQSLKLLATAPVPSRTEKELPIALRTTLLYDPVLDEEEDATVNAGEAALALLRRLEDAQDPEDGKAISDDDYEGTPHDLHRLVVILRRADFPTLERLYQKAAKRPQQRALLLEALPGAESLAAASLVSHLVDAGRITRAEADTWVAARALRGRPSASELSAIADLLKGGGIHRPRLLLAVGALVHAHCYGKGAEEVQEGGTCMDGAAIEVVKKLEEQLGGRCRGRGGLGVDAEKGRLRAETAMRALGNAGVLSPRGHDAIAKCYQDAAVPLSTRVSAVEALRRVPCSAMDQRSLLRVLEGAPRSAAQPRDPAEVRIAAYLALARCPSANTVAAIRELLLKEDVSQVSSFIWSHLRNVQTSSSRWKQQFAALLEDDYLQHKFATDATKFSRNYEASTYFDSIDSGAAVEGNIIFSPESYLPRSAALNLSVEVFGQPLNLLEIGARAEGFEKMVEHFFGPDGYFPDKTVHDLVSSIKGKKDAELENSLSRLSEAFSSAARQRDPQATLYARLFGQEIAFASLDSPKGFTRPSPGALLSSLFAGAGPVDITRTFTLPATSYSVPTCVGLPLTLSLNISGVLTLLAEGLINASSISASLSARATLGADVSLTVGTSATRVGVLVHGSAIATTHTGAELVLRGGKVFNLTLLTPRERLARVRAFSKQFFIQNDRVIAAMAEDQQIVSGSACTPYSVFKHLGISSCLEVTLPEHSDPREVPSFPLSGNAQVSFSVSRMDAFNKMIVGVEVDREHGYMMKLSFDTPGSTRDRAFSLEALFDPGAPSAALRVRAPMSYGLEAVAGLKRNATAAEAHAQLAVNGRQQFSVDGAMQWRRPEGEDGVGAHYAAELTLMSTGQPLKVAGQLMFGEGGYSLQGSIACPLVNGSVLGSVRMSPEGSASDIRAEYEVVGGDRHSAAFSHGYTHSATLISLNASTEMTQFPDLSARLQWSLARERELWEHRLRWERAGEAWKALQRLRAQREGARLHLQALAAVACPRRRLDYSFNVEHKSENGNFSSVATAQLGLRQRYTASLEVTRSPGRRADLEAELASPTVRATLRGNLVKNEDLEGSLEGELKLPTVTHRLALNGTYHAEAQLHQLTAQLRGVLRADARARLAMGFDGAVSHSLHLSLGRARTSYAHFVTYRLDDMRQLLDVAVQLEGRNYSASVEAVRSPTEESTIVRLPFSKDIVLSYKLHSVGSGNFNSVDMEVSWDKHLNPQNFVSLNAKSMEGKTGFLFLYPHNRIAGELTTEPGHVLGELEWAEDQRMTAEARWKRGEDGGGFRADLQTPFDGYENQFILVNYTSSSSAEQFKFTLETEAEFRSRRQSLRAFGNNLHVLGQRDFSSEVALQGSLLPPATLKLIHKSGYKSDFHFSVGDAADDVDIDARAFVLFSEGGVANYVAHVQGALLPLPPWKLTVTTTNNTRTTGFLKCENGFSVDFDLRPYDFYPSGYFETRVPKFGRIHTLIKTSNTTNQAEFYAGDDEPIYMKVQHSPKGSNDFLINIHGGFYTTNVSGQILSNSSGEEKNYFAGFSTRHPENTGGLDIILKHSHSPGEYTTELSLPGIKGNHTLQIHDLLNWETSVNISTEAGESAAWARQSCDAASFQHSSGARAPRWSAPAEARLVAALAQGRLLGVARVEAKLSRPSAAPPLTMSLDLDPGRPALALHLPPHSLDLKGEIDVGDSSGRVSTQLSTSLSQPMNLTAEYTVSVHRSNRSANANGNLVAAWGTEAAGLEVDSTLTLLPGLYQGGLSVVRWRRRGVGDVAKRSDAARANFLLRQPTPRRVTGDAEVVVGDRAASASLDVDVGHNALLASLDVATPIAGWRTLNASAKASYAELGASGSVELRREDRGLMMSSGWQIDEDPKDGSDRYMAEASVTSQFPSLSNASARLVVRASPRRQAADARVSWGADSVATAQASLERHGASAAAGGALQVALETPFEGLQHTEAHFNVINKNGRQTATARLERDAWRVRAEGTCAFSRDGSDASLRVELPEGVAGTPRHINATLRHEPISPNGHSVRLGVAWDDTMLDTDITIATSGEEVAAFVEAYRSHLNGPRTRDLRASFNLAGDELRNRRELVFELDSGGAQFNLSGVLTAARPYAASGRLDASSAFEGASKLLLGVELDYDLAAEKKYAKFSVDAQGKRHELKAETQKERGGRRGQASLVVSSPLTGVVEARAHYDRATAGGGMQARGEVARSSGGGGGVDVAATASYDSGPGFVEAKLETLVTGEKKIYAIATVKDGLLSAQLESKWLSIEALSVAASWAAPEDGRRFARVHLLTSTGWKVTASATLAADFRSADAWLLAEPGTPRLHARYSYAGHRHNVTCVVVGENETFLLATDVATAGAPGGPRGSFNVSHSLLGSLFVRADLSAARGRRVEVMVLDTEDDRLFLGSMAVAKNEISLSTESPFQDLQRLNFTLGFELTPFNHLSLDAVYVGARAVQPWRARASINRKSAKFSVSQPRALGETSATLTYKGVLDGGVEPTLGLTISFNNSKVIETSAQFLFDWQRQIKIDLEMALKQDHGQYKRAVKASCETRFPAKLYLVVSGQKENIAELRGEVTAGNETGFTYRMTWATDNDLQRIDTEVEYYPNEVRMALAVNTSADGSDRRYKALLIMDPEHRDLRLALLTPVPSYENFTLEWRHDEESMRLDTHTTYPGFEHFAVNGRFSLRNNPKRVLELHFKHDDSGIATGLEFMQENGFFVLNSSVSLPGYLAQLRVNFDARGDNKTVSARLELPAGLYEGAGSLSTTQPMEARARFLFPGYGRYEFALGRYSDNAFFYAILKNKVVVEVFYHRKETTATTHITSEIRSFLIKSPLTFDMIRESSPGDKFVKVTLLYNNYGLEVKHRGVKIWDTSLNIKLKCPKGEWQGAIITNHEGGTSLAEVTLTNDGLSLAKLVAMTKSSLFKGAEITFESLNSRSVKVNYEFQLPDLLGLELSGEWDKNPLGPFSIRFENERREINLKIHTPFDVLSRFYLSYLSSLTPEKNRVLAGFVVEADTFGQTHNVGMRTWAGETQGYLLLDARVSNKTDAVLEVEYDLTGKHDKGKWGNVRVSRGNDEVSLNAVWNRKANNHVLAHIGFRSSVRKPSRINLDVEMRADRQDSYFMVSWQLEESITFVSTSHTASKDGFKREVDLVLPGREPFLLELSAKTSLPWGPKLRAWGTFDGQQVLLEAVTNIKRNGSSWNGTLDMNFSSPWTNFSSNMELSLLDGEQSRQILARAKIGEEFVEGKANVTLSWKGENYTTLIDMSFGQLSTNLVYIGSLEKHMFSWKAKLPSGNIHIRSIGEGMSFNWNIDVNFGKKEFALVAVGTWPSGAQLQIRLNDQKPYVAEYILELTLTDARGWAALRFLAAVSFNVTFESSFGDDMSLKIKSKDYGYTFYSGQNEVGNIRQGLRMETALIYPAGKTILYFKKDSNGAWKSELRTEHPKENENFKMYISSNVEVDLRTPWGRMSITKVDDKTYALQYFKHRITCHLDTGTSSPQFTLLLKSSFGLNFHLRYNKEDNVTSIQFLLNAGEALITVAPLELRSSYPIGVNIQAGIFGNFKHYAELDADFPDTVQLLKLCEGKLYAVGGSLDEDLSIWSVFLDVPRLAVDIGFSEKSVEEGTVRKGRVRVSGDMAPFVLNMTFENGDNSSWVNLVTRGLELQAARGQNDVMASVVYGIAGLRGKASGAVMSHPVQSFKANVLAEGLGGAALHAEVADTSAFVRAEFSEADDNKMEGRANASWGGKEITASIAAGDAESSLRLCHDWEEMEVKIGTLLHFLFRPGFAELDTPDGTHHRLQYHVKREEHSFHTSVVIESPLVLSPKAELQLTFGALNELEEASGYAAKVLLVGGGHRHEVDMLMSASTFMNLMAVVISDGVSRVELLADLDVDEDGMWANVSLQLNGTTNTLEVNHQHVFPVRSSIIARLPLLLAAEEVSASLFVDGRQLQAGASRREGAKRHFVQLEGYLNNENRNISFTFESSSFVSALWLTGELLAEDDADADADACIGFNVKSHLSTSDGSFTAVSALGKVTTTAADADATLRRRESRKVPVRVYHARLHVPLKVLLPLTSLNASLDLPNDEDRYGVAFGLQQGDAFVKADASVFSPGSAATAQLDVRRIPRFFFQSQVNLPESWPGPHHLAIRINDREGGAPDGAAVHFAEWDAQRVELRHTFVLERDHSTCSVRLRSPFTEEYSLGLKYLNAQRKMVNLVVFYPGVKEAVVLDFDYEFNGLLDVSLHARYHLPLLPPLLQSAGVRLAHRLITSEGTYDAALDAEAAGRKAGAEASALWASDRLEARLSVHRDADTAWASLRAAARTDGLERLLEVRLGTPLKLLQSASVEFRTAPRRLHAAVSHNERAYLDLSAESGDDTLLIRLVNPFKPVSFGVIYKTHPLYNMSVALGWEHGGLLEERVGARLESSSPGRVAAGAFAQLPGAVPLRVGFAVEESSSAWERSANIAWGPNATALGYTFRVARSALTGSNGIFRIETPVRSFEVSSRRFDRGVQAHYSASVLWDAARDRNKMVGATVARDAAGGVTLSVAAPLLPPGGATLGYRGAVEGGAANAEVRLRVGRGSPSPLDVTLGADATWNTKEQPTGKQPSTKSRNIAGSIYFVDAAAGRDLRVEAAASYFEPITASFNVLYTPGRGMQPRALTNELRVARGVLAVRTDTPEAAVALSARLAEKGFSVTAQVDDRSPIRLKASLLPEDRAVTAELDVGGGRRYLLRASAPHRRRFAMELRLAPEGGVDAPEARASLELRTPRLLAANAFWRPGGPQRLASTFQQELEPFPEAIRAAAASHYYLPHVELRVAVPASLPDPSAVVAFAHAEARLMEEDIAKAADAVRSFYKGNGTYAKDIARVVGLFWSDVSEVIGSAVQAVAELAAETAVGAMEALTTLAKTASQALQLDKAFPALGQVAIEVQSICAGFRDAFLESLGKLVRVSGTLLKKTVEDVTTSFEEQLLNPVLDALPIMLYAYSNTIESLHQKASELAYRVVMACMSVDELREMAEMYSEGVRWIAEGHIQKHVERAMSLIFEVIELVINDLEMAFKQLWEKLEFALPGITIDLRRNYERVLEFLQRYDVLERSLEVLQRWSAETRAKQKGVIALDAGAVSFQQELPVDWPGFDSLPRFQQLVEPDPASKETTVIGAPRTGGAEKAETLLHRAKAMLELSPREIAAKAVTEARRTLPHFSATGALAPGHVLTFDGHTYPFKGECSYLLTGDLMHYTYAILVHYTSQPNSTKITRSFTILTGDHSINVSPDYSLNVDGTAIDLPARWPDLAATRTETTVEVTAKDIGLRFRCHVTRHVCTVHLSGWLFGRTAGLLGSFNRDRNDDLAGPEGAIKTEAAMARAYRVGRCRAYHRIGATTTQEEEATSAPTSGPNAVNNQTCAQVFESSSSSIKECFAAVNPAPYEAMCRSSGVCFAAFTYVAACATVGVIVPMPPGCESCRLPNGEPLAVGATAATSANPQADIILMMERGCEAASEGAVAAASEAAEAALAARGIGDVRFALVEFGDLVAPHLRTTGGRLWSDAKTLQKTLVRGPREQWNPPDSSDASVDTSPEAALTLGASLHGRAGAARAMVLLHCSNCSRDGFAPLWTRLALTEASLHVLRPGALSSPGPRGGARPEAKRARALGVDGRGLVNVGRRNGQRPSEPGEVIIAKALAPKDACAAAALESGGSLFDVEKAAPASKASTGKGGVGAKRFWEAWGAAATRPLRPQPCARVRCAAAGYTLCVPDEGQYFQDSEEVDEEFERFLQRPQEK